MSAKTNDSNRLPPQLEHFVQEYLKDFCGVRAWRASHPKNKSYQAANTSARRALAHNHLIRARVEKARAEFYSREQMEADEALALLSRQARAAISDFVGDNGELLKPHEWPEELRHAVRRYEPGGKLELHDQQNALRLLAMAGGKLGDGPEKPPFTLEMFLRDKPPVID